MEPPHPRAYGVLCLAVLCLATTWPVSKLALADATPLWFALSRAGLSTLVSSLVLLAMGRLRLPTRGDLPIVASIAVLQLAGFFALTNLGLRHLPSGRAVVLAFTMTIWLVPMALLVGERIGAWRLSGVIAGLAGVAVLCGPLVRERADRHLLAGTAFLLLAALAWALAIFHARHHRWRRSPLELLPWQMALATLLLAALAALLEPHGRIGTAPGTLLAVLYIGAVAGPLATWASNSAARGLPMLVNSLGFLAVPVLGIAVSSLWLGEALTPSLLLGAVLILLGVALVAIGAAFPR